MVRKQQVKNRGLIDLDHELDAGQWSVLDLRYNGADSPDDEELDETMENLVALEKMTDLENPLPEFGEVVTERQLADSAPNHKLYPSHQDGSRRSLVVLKQWYADHHSTCDAKQLWGKATFTGEIAAGEAPLALPGLRCRCHLTAWRIRQPSMVFQVWPIAVILTHHFRGHRISREASGEEAIPEAVLIKTLLMNEQKQVVSYVLTNVTILLMIRLLTTTAVNPRGQRYFIQHYLQEALPTGSKSQRKGADFQLADSTVSVKRVP
ncbi:hypothetical protein T10_1063 [Trichinella papuae]|uniref:Uncharacterized protein n=1 Tax=Trichinella papuae TaxID=268474 RepID=A0A0V1M113_9BILA|nr:hypothetical protein T10_1063 [Trichinella papuae]